MKYYNRRWEALPAGVGPSSILEKILLARGIENIPEFLHPRAPADSLPGSERARVRILQALREGEKVCIFADYDVDGVSSAAIAARFFRHHGLQPSVILPSRYGDGYGLSAASLRRIPEDTQLLITVDCGITSVEEVRLLSRRMDIIITDHHEPKEELPEAILVSPKLENYPFADLSGSGVIYRLLSAAQLDMPEGLASLAMLGTIADVMPLTGENRYIVRKGLDEIRSHPLTGLSRWLLHAGMDGANIRSEDIAFRLAPLLNAPGRIAHPLPAFTLLSSDDPIEAENALQACLQANARRKEMTLAMTPQISPGSAEPAILRFSPDWKIGLAGLAAGKYAELFQRPALFFAQEGNLLRGSARAPKGFDLLPALRETSGFLLRYGGHQSAAGLELKVEDFPAFEAAFHRYVKAHPLSAQREPLWYLNIHPSQVGIRLLDELELLEPCGPGNETVRFVVRGMRLDSTREMGSAASRLDFSKGSASLQFVNFSGLGRQLLEGLEYDLLFEVKRNVFRGVLRMQLQLIDVHARTPLPSYFEPFFAPFYEHLSRLIRSYNPSVREEMSLLPLTKMEEEGEEAEFLFEESVLPNLSALRDPKERLREAFIELLPGRDELVETYRELKSKQKIDWRDPKRAGVRTLARKIFEELGIISYTKGSEEPEIVCSGANQRFHLENSRLYRNSQAILEAWSELF